MGDGVAQVMTGGEAIVAGLLANGVDTVFGLPGAQVYPLFDALARQANQIRTIGARHEQACGAMAFGYARSSGRPGVFAVVPGPGVLNTGAALCTAAGTCSPVVCLTGQVPSAFLGRGRGHLHELPDQLATLRTVVKWAGRIERPAEAPAVIDEAFRQAMSGRPGPVAVEMCWDTMAVSETVTPESGAAKRTAPAPDPAAVERAAALLRGARRPMIILGSGAQGARAEVLALAEALGAAVTSFRGGRGIVPADHPLWVGSYGAYLLWPEVDAVVGIGTRLELPTMRWTGMMRLVEAMEKLTVRVEIDAGEMRRLGVSHPVVADAAEGAAALLAAVRGRTAPDSGWGEAIAAARTQARAAAEAIQPHVGHLDAIRAALPRDGILVDEMCQAGYASYYAWDAFEPRSYVTSGYQGTLGLGVMTALGAKAAHPERAVVSITGDGGLLFALGELATAAQYGLGVAIVLFNNGAYGNVMRDQRERFGGRVIGSALTNPDFAAVAGAFGVTYRRAEDCGALEESVRAAVGEAGPTLIEVPVPAETTSPWPLIRPT